MPGPYQLVQFDPFTRGVDLLTSETYLEPGYVAIAKDVEFNRGVVSSRKGYGGRSYNNSGAIDESASLPLDDQIIGLIRFWPYDGIEREVVITDEFAYSYAFSNGNFTSLFDSDGSTPVQCFVDASGATSISWTICPVNKTPDARPTLVFTDGIFYTGQDHTMYEWDASSSYHANLAAGRITMDDFTDFKFAKQIAWFGDHFMIGDYNDNGKRYRNRVAWGDDNQMGIVTGGTDNGQVVLGDANGYMRRFIRLGSHLVIYFSDSIVICDPIPTDEIYSFETRVRGTGLLGPRAVVDVGGAHIFIGQDNIYMYDGGLQPRPIGDKVTDRLFSMINPDATDGIVAQHLPRKNVVNFYFPIEGATSAKGMLSYNYRDDTFSGPGEVAHGITASGFGVRTVSYHCSDAVFSGLTCEDLGNKRCNEYSFQAGFAVPTLGTVDGDLFDMTEVHLKDDGEWIFSRFATASKAVGESYGTWGRIMEFQFESKGTAFLIYYSTDHGNSWIKIPGSWGEVDTTKFSKFTVPVDIVTQFIMVRVAFINVGNSTEIRSIIARLRPTAVRNI